VIKADAYGHGAPEVARALAREGCRFFAASSIEEAIAVRKVVKDAEILIFGNLIASHVELLLRHRLTVTLFSAEQARSLAAEAVRLGGVLSAHIKLDTGMNRLGFPVCTKEARQQSLSEIEALFSLDGVAVSGIYSHFATADETEREDTHEQAARFFAVTEELERKGFSLGVRHIGNSAGALRYPEYAMDAVRLGIALYGYPPCETEGVTLSPVMRLETTVTHLHTAPAHTRVGYGGVFEANEPRQIATLSIGYADGWLRAYTGATVTVHTAKGDFRAPIVGRICMDQCMLDVTGLPVSRGDRVTLFGQTPDELMGLAERANTIPYECLCLISARVPREGEDA
jgi:alanine racemase